MVHLRPGWARRQSQLIDLSGSVSSACRVLGPCPAPPNLHYSELSVLANRTFMLLEKSGTGVECIQVCCGLERSRLGCVVLNSLVAIALCLEGRS